MKYRDLYEIIPSADWNKFCYAKYYEHEQTILKPAMEHMGYTDVHFEMGEEDSFGPLTRIVIARKDGHQEKFIYD